MPPITGDGENAAFGSTTGDGEGDNEGSINEGSIIGEGLGDAGEGGGGENGAAGQGGRQTHAVCKRVT